MRMCLLEKKASKGTIMNGHTPKTKQMGVSSRAALLSLLSPSPSLARSIPRLFKHARTCTQGKYPPSPGAKAKGVGDGPKDGQLKFCSGPHSYRVHTNKYIYTHIYTYIYKHIHIYLYIYTHEYIYKYTYVCVCIYLHLNLINCILF